MKLLIASILTVAAAAAGPHTVDAAPSTCTRENTFLSVVQPGPYSQGQQINFELTTDCRFSGNTTIVVRLECYSEEFTTDPNGTVFVGWTLTYFEEHAIGEVFHVGQSAQQPIVHCSAWASAVKPNALNTPQLGSVSFPVGV